ncbi:N-lysine methyltransferase setd6-like isoform X2 [Acanthaster planci]|uniref:N-lysine methyltransferase n=1 Tax=Acanthaster planci TaxID=133434 RepID=A0A8B7ZTH0_ACAPL|nr:N-lysine methyltransferase setd6-like isoform X2 [Acanthaster planci]
MHVFMVPYGQDKRNYMYPSRNSPCPSGVRVHVGTEGSCIRYGMIAIDNIAEGEILFTIPRECLLHPDNCSITALLQQGESELQSESGWVPLVLCLMFEYTCADSKWRPYLDLCPDRNQLDLPMFWDRETISKELQGTGVPDVVYRDVENICHEYHSVAVPFMKKNPEYFDLSVHTLELYRKLVAFVMAYSFTSPKQTSESAHEESVDDDAEEGVDDEAEDVPTLLTMMVPMADILNHVAKNNARLQFGQSRLSMIATRDINKDEEIFNTYGELPNWQLLQMYGFVEKYPENIYDTVDLPLILLREHLEFELDDHLAQAKWNFLRDTEEMLDDNIIIGLDGILNKWETYQTLKICTMTSADFKKLETSFVDEDLDEEGEDGHIEDSLEELFSFDGLMDLPSPWRQLLMVCATKHLKSFKNTMEEDMMLVSEENSTCNASTLNRRQKYACYLRIGQRKLLVKLMQCLKTESGTGKK